MNGGSSHPRCNENADDQQPRIIIAQSDEQSRCSSVEVELCVSLLDDLFIGLFEVLRQNHISVLSYGLHASLLGDGLNVGGGDFLWATHKVLQVDLFAQIHFTR